MPLGPVELIVIKFPGNKFTGEITPALADLVDKGLVRIIDLLFFVKDEDGNVLVEEIANLGDDEYAQFEAVVSDVNGMLNEEDAQQFGGLLEPNSSAGLLLFEHTWAKGFADALANADGELLYAERIPRAVIEALEAEVEAEA
jgi:Family of unknown function (DUF6325)